MVSLIKNQILKHLSRFTKNLSPDKINVSTFKGEGELSSLELDEIVLTELLELPSWVRLTSAWCNKVSFRIPWTKLKSVPISIFLDEVNVEIETCEELRSLSAQQGLSTYSTPTKYNFINKVIDGMCITVNMVAITFKTPAFIASVQIMRIVVESKTPTTWKAAELSKTRLKDSARGQILVFKGLEWQTLRLEASSTKDTDLPPLRLLTNRATCKLTIKKRISDCFVMGCKLILRLDDLLWVLTDSQLKAVLHFTDSLSGLIQKANETTRIRKAARKLEMLPEYLAQLYQQARSTEPTPIEQVFARFDVVETSYHFIGQKINLHLTDDPGAGRSSHPSLLNGSAVCLKISVLQVDYYPYHLAASNRNHWGRYNPDSSPHVQWLTAAQNSFKTSLMQLLDTSNKKVVPDKNPGDDTSSPDKSFESSPSNNLVKKYVVTNLAKVMTSCIVLRVEDFTMYRVTTTNKQTPKEFIKGDRHAFPSDVTMHAEFTYYYYPGDVAFPLPPPKFYVQLNPVIVNFDLLTVLWLNSFALNLHQSLLLNKQDSPTNMNYLDVKIEAIMPKLIFECGVETQCSQRDRPKSLHFQVSRALLSNVRSPDWCSRTDLAKCIHATQLGSLFYGGNFPIKENDEIVISNKFIDHIHCKDNIKPMIESLPTGSVAELVEAISKTLLWTEARDIWCINIEPVWGDFYGARGVAHNRPVAFLDAFPLKIWMHIDQPKNDIHALAHITNLISLQINHYQLLFLLRLADDLTELVTILEIDAQRIKKDKSSLIVVGAVIPQVEVTLVMPSQTPGKESSGADLESVIPDSSSIADDIVTNPSIQWNSVLTTNLQDGGIYKRDNTTVGSPQSEPNSMKMFPIQSGYPAKIDSPKSNLNSLMQLSSVKKGFTSFSKMIDSALKPVSDDAISDSISIRSDGSSESDNSVMIKLSQADDMFAIDANDALSEGIDMGSEAFEEDNNSGTTMSVTTASESHSNASSYKRRDLISVATFKLGQVEFVQQSQGLVSLIKAQVSNIAIEDCAAIPWDEFQNKFSTRSRGWTEVCELPADRPRIRLRKEHSVTPGDISSTNLKISSWFDDLVTVSLSNINLALNVSTISSIAEFSVDDVSSPSLPVEVHLENLELTLIDDRPTMQTAGNPSNIHISKLYVQKTKDGSIKIEPPSVTPVSTPISEEVTGLKTENEQLRRRLIALERLNEENHRLRKSEEETEILRTSLNEAQEQLNVLLSEKQGLLDIIKTYQQSKSDGRPQSSGKR